jgi:hypothetical protein
MPTLNWIGKEAVVKHLKDVLFRLLEHVPEQSRGDGVVREGIVSKQTRYALPV